MKICLLSGAIGRGGAFAMSYYVTKYLVSKGIYVDIFTSDIYEETEHIQTLENINIFRLPISSQFFKYFEFSFRAKKTLEKQGLDKYDIIHCNDGWGSLALSIGKEECIKKIYTPQSVVYAMVDKSYRGEYVPLQNRIGKYTLYKGLHYFNKIGLENSDMVLPLSKSTGKEIKEYFDIDPNKIHVIPNGVDFEEFNLSKYEIIQETINNGNKIVIICAGRLVVQKGYSYLIKAIKDITLRGFRNIQVIILGEGLLEKYLKKMCRDYKVQEFVRFIGHIPREKIHSWYKSSDIFICPSLYEPFGNVNIEAMASNLPVIASDVGGIPEIVKDKETGLLVPPRDPKALADAIITLIEDEKLRRNMGKAGRKRAEKYFDWKIIAKNTLKVYKKTLRE